MYTVLLAFLSCHRATPPDPGLDLTALTTLVRPGTPDARGWAEDVRTAIGEAGVVPDRDHACEVLAIIEQESGYSADPAVPGLAAIVDAEIEESLGGLGPLEKPTRAALLDHVAPGRKETFAARLKRVKTEQDVDLLFRDIVAYHEARAPRLAQTAELFFPRLIERHNPVATVGSMQVSVAWAQARGKAEGLEPETVRDLLYTRRGGIHFGVLRLFSIDALYDDPIYRFADYNAGPFASRNAAFQSALAALTGLEVVPDGDLLLYDGKGRPRSEDGQSLQALLAWRLMRAPDLSETRIRKDVRKEKERAFEATQTWDRLRSAYRARFGNDPPYAQLPDVALESPKLAKGRTTRWFAERVDARYEACRARK
jgi:hypothetical protein